MNRRFEIERVGKVLHRAHEAPAPEADCFAAPPSSWRCDLADETLHWEPGVFELFGIPPGTRVARPEVLELYSEESREELERVRNAAIARCGNFMLDARICRVDGVVRWIRIIGEVVSSRGRATHLQGSKRDVTIEAMLAGKLG